MMSGVGRNKNAPYFMKKIISERVAAVNNADSADNVKIDEKNDELHPEKYLRALIAPGCF